MAKQSGIGDNFYLSGVDMSGDVAAVNTIAGRRTMADVTAINASAVERIPLLMDGEISFTSYWNDNAAGTRAAGAGSTMVVLSALPATDVVVSYCRGTTLGSPAAALVAKQVNYDPTRGQDGSLTMVTQCLAQGSPLSWGTQITAGKITHASATNSTGEVTAISTVGGVGYLQYFSRATGTPTFLIEHSSDTTNGIDGTWATLLTFAGTGGASAFGERKTVTGTVNKGLRARTTGTFTTAIFAISFRRGVVGDAENLA